MDTLAVCFYLYLKKKALLLTMNLDYVNQAHVPAQPPPPTYKSYTRTTIEVQILPPSDNGGAPVTSYIISYSSNMVSWASVTTTNMVWSYPYNNLKKNP